MDCKGWISAFVNRRHQQDSLWSWMVLFTATFGDGLVLAMTYCFSVILPALVSEFKETREKVAWVSSIAFSLSFLASPLSAMVCVRLGNRWTSAIGTIMCVVGLISSSFSASLELMYFTFGVLFGVGSSFVHVAGILLVQRYFRKRRSLATGIFAGSSSFSSMLGPLFQMLNDILGWRRTFWVIGLWFVVPLILVLVLYSPNVDDGMDDEHRSTATSKRCKLTCSYWNSWYTIGVIAIGLESFAIYGPLTHMIKHADEVGYPEKKSSMLLVYIGIFSLVGKVATGRILDSPRCCVFWMSQLAPLIASISIVILRFAKDDFSFIAFAIVYGLGNGSFVSSMYLLWLTSVKPEHRAPGLATGEVIAAVGVMVGIPFLGFLADRTGSYNISFNVYSAMLFATSIFLFLRFCFKKQSFEEERRKSVFLLEDLHEKELLERETVL